MGQYQVSKQSNKTQFNKSKRNTTAKHKDYHKQLITTIGLLGLVLEPTVLMAAGDLIKTIPKQAYSIPAGPLNSALPKYTEQAGVMLGYDPALTEGLTSSGLKGEYGFADGFKELLKGSGLEVISNPKGELELRKAPVIKVSESENLPLNAELSTVQVRAKRFYEIGPLPGLGLTKEEIPGNVQSITAKEIKESHSLSLTDLMNKKLQSVTVNDYQGNPFQMDVQYRGFTAGPQIGTPQGLSVFFDGIRVNEPFGDVVNWDMIPMNAIANFDVFPGSNPLFGLGTLGGAISVKTKDGFNNEGVDAEVLTGSFGRKQLQVEGGWNNGTVALFGAGNFFMEDGWRDNSPSKVNQFFGKASYRGDKLDLSFSSLIVGNDLVGNGVVPTNFYEQDRNSVFTSPDTTKNRLAQFQLAGNYFVNDNFTVTGQVYRRNSKRKQKNADVYSQYGTQALSQNFAEGEDYTCKFRSTNGLGIPDYVVFDIPDPNDYSSSPFLMELFNGNYDPNLLSSQDLPDYFLAGVKSEIAFFQNPTVAVIANQYTTVPNSGAETTYSNGEVSYIFEGINLSPNFAAPDPSFPVDFNVFAAIGASFFYTTDGVKHVVAFKQAVNGDNCINTQATSEAGIVYNPLYDANGRPRLVDGAGAGDTGVVEGIPTAVITNNQINQIVDGASVQLNWNLDKHKFMVGVSIDNAYAEYKNSQRLGFFDAQRDGSLDPDRALDIYRAADQDIENNNFDGNSLTKSIYASETWSPVDTVHVTGAVRYNQTRVKSTLAARDAGQAEISLSDLLNYPNLFDLCTDAACNIETGYRVSDGLISKLPPESEKFSYYSLNPSLGSTWQIKENLNLYANWSQGTRTPSVIELGCAIDKTPVSFAGGYTVPRSVALGRSCQLPNGLSGDPFLPQVKAETFDLGMRGRWANAVDWNFGYYRTELKDDIYMVTYSGNQNFFDSIGKTRRQGLEMGMNGELGKLRFGLNYALTDAKFRSTFITASNDNSSTQNAQLTTDGELAGVITVKPGSTIPGVSLHNLNASLSYDVTEKWTVGMSAVMHSWSYLRGNENNEHRKGVAIPVSVLTFDTVTNQFVRSTVSRQPTTNPGKIPGYTVFNFQTSFKFSPEWTATLLVNNIFDKEYFSAGRLGRNAFSPSINGAIGPDGYNHNSSDWLSTNFIGPGAPRAAWFALRYSFVPDKK